MKKNISEKDILDRWGNVTCVTFDLILHPKNGHRKAHYVKNNSNGLFNWTESYNSYYKSDGTLTSSSVAKTTLDECVRDDTLKMVARVNSNTDSSWLVIVFDDGTVIDTRNAADGGITDESVAELHAHINALENQIDEMKAQMMAMMSSILTKLNA